jgi:hypothetical protein
MSGVIISALAGTVVMTATAALARNVQIMLVRQRLLAVTAPAREKRGKIA